MSFIAEGKSSGDAYQAPDPQFISAVSLFNKSLPWERFKKFFQSRRFLGLKDTEQLILLRLLALQEYLCLDDVLLLRWLKHQFYLLSFLQPDFHPKMPTEALYRQFRTELDAIGLLEPFRKHCHHIIHEHEKRQSRVDFTFDTTFTQHRQKPSSAQGDEAHNVHFSASLIPEKESPIDGKVADSNPDIHNLDTFNGVFCEKCGSQNVVRIKPSVEASRAPTIRFLRCRFCGHTFRDPAS